MQLRLKWYAISLKQYGLSLDAVEIQLGCILDALKIHFIHLIMIFGCLSFGYIILVMQSFHKQFWSGFVHGWFQVDAAKLR